MREDPIVAEMRQFRAEHAKKYGHDLDRICEALREQQVKSKRNSGDPRPPFAETKWRLTYASKASARHGRRANWLAHQ